MDEDRSAGAGAGRSLEDEAWERARARAREEVRAAFARGDEVPLRRCPRCGVETRTRWETCPHCGWSYFRRPPRLSKRARRVLAGLALLGVAAGASQLIPALERGKRSGQARVQAKNERILAAEVRRLRREQRPRRGSAGHLRPPVGARAPAVLRARRAFVRFVETAITADARRRVARGELSGQIRVTTCGPLAQVHRGQRATPDHEDLTKPIGRYDCTVVQRDVVRRGEVVGKFGYPFVAALDFRRFTYTFCKNNPIQGERGAALAHVRLDRACLAARGRPFAGGYLIVPDRPLEPPPR
jgi:hypothetical protein